MLDISLLHNQAKSHEALDKISDFVFKKTQIGIGYNDVDNWERQGLISIGGLSKKIKGEQKKISYSQYAWIHIVKQLLFFNFNYDEIKLFKEFLFYSYSAQELYKGALAKVEELRLISEDAAKTLIEMGGKEEVINSVYLPRTALELLLVNTISDKSTTSIQFYKGMGGTMTITCNSIIQEIHKSGKTNEFIELSQKPHLNIPLNKIVLDFFDTTQIIKSNEPIILYSEILTKAEVKVLSAIRNRYNKIESVEVKLKNGKLDKMFITEYKKVELETRLIEHIKNNEYLDIEIKLEKGKVSSCRNTRKIKL